MATDRVKYTIYMREGAPIERSPFTLFGIWSRILYRFNYGDTPPPGLDHATFQAVANPRLSGLACSVHPGPLNEAISSARSLQKCLLVYVYCVDSPECAAVDSLFRSAPIAEHISAKFVLYATSATVTDGWAIVTGTKFKSLPLFLFVRPTAETLPKCQIFVSHEGVVSEDLLMSFLESSSFLDGGRVRAEQDRQFMEVLQEDEAQQAEPPVAIQEPAEGSKDREKIEKEFNDLPVIEAGDPDACRVKFQFPDNSHRVQAFPRGAPAWMLFVFARYYQFPRGFALETGHPMKKINEDEATIEEACGGRQVQVYVVDSDE
jgi:hypothetical protein